MPGIPALGVGKRQEGQEFKVSLGYNTKFEASMDYMETQSQTGTARKRHIVKASSCVGVFTVTPSKRHSRQPRTRFTSGKMYRREPIRDHAKALSIPSTSFGLPTATESSCVN